jgi:hypothetical protein
MQKPPASLLNDLDDAARSAVLDWWSKLDDADRSSLMYLFDSGWSDPSFGFLADADVDFRPEVRTRPFLSPWRPSAEDALALQESYEDFREFLMNNPGNVIASMFGEVHFLNYPEKRAYDGRTITRISGWPIVTEHHFVDWNRIRLARWMLPPSESGKRRKER